MTVFFDTNVVLDWLLDRRDTFAEEVMTLFTLAEEGRIRIWVSSGTLYTVAYVLFKANKRGQKLRATMKDFLSLVEVVPAGKSTFLSACEMDEMFDLEDAFQYQIALQTESLYFVTGNIQDFRTGQRPDLPVLTPAELLNILNETDK